MMDDLLFPLILASALGCGLNCGCLLCLFLLRDEGVGPHSRGAGHRCHAVHQ